MSKHRQPSEMSAASNCERSSAEVVVVAGSVVLVDKAEEIEEALEVITISELVVALPTDEVVKSVEDSIEVTGSVEISLEVVMTDEVVLVLTSPGVAGSELVMLISPDDVASLVVVLEVLLSVVVVSILPGRVGIAEISLDVVASLVVGPEVLLSVGVVSLVLGRVGIAESPLDIVASVVAVLEVLTSVGVVSLVLETIEESVESPLDVVVALEVLLSVGVVSIVVGRLGIAESSLDIVASLVVPVSPGVVSIVLMLVAGKVGIAESVFEVITTNELVLVLLSPDVAAALVVPLSVGVVSIVLVLVALSPDVTASLVAVIVGTAESVFEVMTTNELVLVLPPPDVEIWLVLIPLGSEDISLEVEEVAVGSALVSTVPVVVDRTLLDVVSDAEELPPELVEGGGKLEVLISVDEVEPGSIGIALLESVDEESVVVELATLEELDVPEIIGNMILVGIVEEEGKLETVEIVDEVEPEVIGIALLGFVEREAEFELGMLEELAEREAEFEVTMLEELVEIETVFELVTLEDLDVPDIIGKVILGGIVEDTIEAVPENTEELLPPPEVVLSVESEALDKEGSKLLEEVLRASVLLAVVTPEELKERDWLEDDEDKSVLLGADIGIVVLAEEAVVRSDDIVELGDTRVGSAVNVDGSKDVD